MTNVIPFPLTPKPHAPEPPDVDATVGAEIHCLNAHPDEHAMFDLADTIIEAGIADNRMFDTTRVPASDLRYGDMLLCDESDAGYAQVDGIEWQGKHVIVRTLCTINGSAAMYFDKRAPDEILVISRWLEWPDE